MGIDGVNYLTIIGNTNILNTITTEGIILSNEEVNNDSNIIYLKETILERIVKLRGLRIRV